MTENVQSVCALISKNVHKKNANCAQMCKNKKGIDAHLKMCYSLIARKKTVCTRKKIRSIMLQIYYGV